MPRLLEPAIQHYAWGDTEYLPALLGVSNPEGRPFAELWMGAHSDLPTPAHTEEGLVPLNELIARSPADLLGSDTARRFGGGLPFLLKILSARTPLSIQAHPGEEQARKGYEREEALGIPLSSTHRSYRDLHHKPELLVALTDFYALVGFRPVEEIQRALHQVPELGALAPFEVADVRGLRALYESWMTLPAARVERALAALLDRLRRRDAERRYGTEEREHWLLLADAAHTTEGRPDRGLLSFYLLNLVHLRPGEGVFLAAGRLHAYLRGSGVELMASSNNVLRGGLTRKRVDVPELLRTIAYDPAPPAILRPKPRGGGVGERYETSVAEFELERLRLEPGKAADIPPSSSASILVVTEAGEPVELASAVAEKTLSFSKGGSVFVPAGASCVLRSDQAATLFRAGVPEAKPTRPSFRGRHPEELRFGTSGLRGKVEHISDLEAYVNTAGFLELLLQAGRTRPGEIVYLAGDLRPSTDGAERSILRAVARAVLDAGLRVENLGRIPTPALAAYGLTRARASIMVTGSHIPFDRNGIKFHKPDGEVSKDDEAEISRAVARVRAREYAKPAARSIFEDDGSFRERARPELPPASDDGHRSFTRRYLEFFPAGALGGLRVVVFQHSAVGRDLLVEVLGSLGATAVAAGRTERFLPIDTEDVSEERLATLQSLADEARRGGTVDAVVSTDGDSDRPLVAGLDEVGRVRFFGGDLVGILVADFLGADAISVPVSANDAVDRWFRGRGVSVRKTRIGSPYVLASMEDALTEGFERVVGWEANGGFLTGSRVTLGDRALEPLPTRDAFLPILSVLHLAASRGRSLVELFSELPPRYSKAGLLDQFPRETSSALLARYAPGDGRIRQVTFDDDEVTGLDDGGGAAPLSSDAASSLSASRRELEEVFGAAEGFGRIARISFVDGMRLFFDNGDIAHVRPSGNAPQLRIYAVADSQNRADEIVATAVREPDGLLRRLSNRVER